MDIVILGLSLTSSWGNGHATTYRALVKALNDRGHRVLFLERDVPWYASQRDLPVPPFCTVRLYQDLDDLQRRFASEVAGADLVIQGSYVPDGVAVGDWVTQKARGVKAFYDIDTPVTLAKLAREDYEYLHPRQIAAFDLYLSFTGGPTLDKLEWDYNSPMARPLYCAVDPEHYYPEPSERDLDLGYMGTYSDDRQPTVERLLLEPARRWPAGRFMVAGPQYPAGIDWPVNVERVAHLPPAQHRAFYNRQRFTLNVTRRDMIRAGFAPSVRLFEAAACATPVISDPWPGLDTFFALGREIMVAETPEHVIGYLEALPEETRRRIGESARARVLAQHTAAHRAETLEGYIDEVRSKLPS